MFFQQGSLVGCVCVCVDGLQRPKTSKSFPQQFCILETVLNLTFVLELNLESFLNSFSQDTTDV